VPLSAPGDPGGALGEHSRQPYPDYKNAGSGGTGVTTQGHRPDHACVPRRPSLPTAQARLGVDQGKKRRTLSAAIGPIGPMDGVR